MKTTKINQAGIGRKRVYATELPVYDSMEQCSGATAVPLAALKLAKKQGCLFIRHGRVHFSEFINWFFNRPDTEDTEENAVDWSRRDKRASAMIKEVSLQKLNDSLIEFSVAERFIRHIVGVGFFGELDRIANEFPANLKGKNEVEINAECLAQTEKIKKAIKQTVEVWCNKKGNV